MKYIIGASIGGLFGIGMPLMMEFDMHNPTNEEYSRLEEFQPAEKGSFIPIKNMLLIPDNYCGLIDYSAIDPAEQAKECLVRSETVVPAI